MTVHEVSRRTGVSVRALHHYDSIGLLPPAAVTEAGYRLYDGAALERLQQILLFRELEFPLREIRRILDSPHFDRAKALEQQIRLLELRREQLDNLIALARDIQKTGGKTMDFEAFDTQKIDESREEARKSWGDTPAWQEYEQKSKTRTKTEERQLGDGLMEVLGRFHDLLDQDIDKAHALFKSFEDREDAMRRIRQIADLELCDAFPINLEVSAPGINKGEGLKILDEDFALEEYAIAVSKDRPELTEAINNCDGTAQTMSDTMQDNLEGQLTILKSQLVPAYASSAPFA